MLKRITCYKRTKNENTKKSFTKEIPEATIQRGKNPSQDTTKIISISFYICHGKYKVRDVIGDKFWSLSSSLFYAML